MNITPHVASTSDRDCAATAEPELLWRELVGKFLRHQRTWQHRTLTDVASAAGVSAQYLSEIERGLKDPSSELLAAVLRALGLRLAHVHRWVLEQLEEQDRAGRGRFARRVEPSRHPRAEGQRRQHIAQVVALRAA